MKRIYLHHLDGEEVIAWSGEPFRDLLARALEESAGWTVCDSPDAAELVLLMELCCQKGREHPAKLLADPIFSTHAKKTATLNIDINPVPFLPGAYVNLPQAKHTAATIATGYLMVPNARVAHWAEQRDCDRRWLASFRGTVNCVARQQFFAQAESFGADFSIQEPTDGWYQHSGESKDRYCQEMLESHFVLCPGGLGPSSYRLYEAMQLERAAVILSDQWSPPEGIDWSQCALQLQESDIPRLPEILRAKLPDAPRLAANGRRAWEQHFAQDRQLGWILDQLSALLASGKTQSAAAYRRQWSGESFWAQHGLARHQQIWRRLRKMTGR